MPYLYLHGFASSPQSQKAQFFVDQWARRGLDLTVPDLNDGDFTHLTLTRQLALIQKTVLEESQGKSWSVIGSSFGGLTAAWLAQNHPQIDRLVLLAPAFNFIHHWLQKLPPAQLQTWQTTGEMAVYHYGDRREYPLAYGFVEDALGYDEQQLQRPVPTLILHGRYDDVVPLTASEAYAHDRPWVKLVAVDSDHSLTDCLPELTTAIADFFALPPGT